MQYLGGKTRIAKLIAAEIDKIRKPGQWVWDPFCGGLSVSVALSKNGPVYATDICAPLIALYKAVQNGWEPPITLTREEYSAARLLPDTDPLKAFVGFGCSFGGKWFGGYSSSRPKYARPIEGAAKIVKRDVSCGAKFGCLDFLNQPIKPTSGIIYMDPPYSGVTGYGSNFDHDRFCSNVREWSAFTDVFVSEYNMPFGTILFEREQRTSVNSGISGSSISAVERLYYIARGSL